MREQLVQRAILDRRNLPAQGGDLSEQSAASGAPPAHQDRSSVGKARHLYLRAQGDGPGNPCSRQSRSII